MLVDDSTDHERELGLLLQPRQDSSTLSRAILNTKSRCTDIFVAAADSYARFLSTVS
jgi:hypothetical protein